jgi:hypothetical protein
MRRRWKRLHLGTHLSQQRPRNPLLDTGLAHSSLQYFLKRLNLQLDLGFQPRNFRLAVIWRVRHLSQQEALMR